MSNRVLAKLEDHVSGRKRDDDTELALSVLSNLGYSRSAIVRAVLTGGRLEPNVLSILIRITGYHDGSIISKFPKNLQDFAAETLKNYYRRRSEW